VGIVNSASPGHRTVERDDRTWRSYSIIREATLQENVRTAGHIVAGRFTEGSPRRLFWFIW
jgi:hypothetical protein